MFCLYFYLWQSKYQSKGASHYQLFTYKIYRLYTCYCYEYSWNTSQMMLNNNKSINHVVKVKKKDNIIIECWGRRGRNGMVVGFTTTYAIIAYHHWCYEFESRSGRGVQHYVMKCVSELRQVGGFLWVLQFTPPIKLTATI